MKDQRVGAEKAVDYVDELILHLHEHAGLAILANLISRLHQYPRNARWIRVVEAMAVAIMPSPHVSSFDETLVLQFAALLAPCCYAPLMGHPDVLNMMERSVMPRCTWAVQTVELSRVREKAISILACAYSNTKSVLILSQLIECVKQSTFKDSQELCVKALVDILFSDLDTMPGKQVHLCLDTLVYVLREESGSNCSESCVLFVLDCLWRMHPSGSGAHLSILTFSGEEDPYYLQVAGLAKGCDCLVSRPSTTMKKNVGTSMDLTAEEQARREGRSEGCVNLDTSTLLEALVAVYIRTSTALCVGTQRLSDKLAGTSLPKR